MRSGGLNVDETEYGTRKSGWHLEQTTAVGLYPHGRSPYGVEDLAGTVWEWCLNKYDDEEAVAPDTSGASRALRGGAWYLSPASARADYRRGSRPDLRFDAWGFRLLSSVPIDAVR
jgi:formylglycine-generating enzyme required for sulfatase activity